MNQKGKTTTMHKPNVTSYDGQKSPLNLETQSANATTFPLLVQGQLPCQPFLKRAAGGAVFFFRVAIAAIGLTLALTGCRGPLLAPDYSAPQEQAASAAGAGLVALAGSAGERQWQSAQVEIAESKAWLNTQRVLAEARSRNWVGAKQWGQVEKMFANFADVWQKRGTVSKEFAWLAREQLAAAFKSIERTESIRNRNR